MIELKSEFAILDVTAGRDVLKRRIDRGEPVGVVIEATIDHVHSRDDGMSREFGLSVHSVKEVAPAGQSHLDVTGGIFGQADFDITVAPVRAIRVSIPRRRSSSARVIGMSTCGPP
jgi:hypothetical protein